MWGNDTMCPDKAPIGTPTLSHQANVSSSSDNDYPSWWRRTTYRHFGPDCDRAHARAVVESPQAVARHAFWPFVRYDKRVRRFDYAAGKPSYKIRSVQYPAQLDANIFAYYAERLSPLYEARLRAVGLTDQVTAYRALGRSNVDFAAEAFAWIRDHASCSVYCFDVSQFFDNLDHTLLKDDWCGLLGEERLPADHFAVYKAVTRYAYVQREHLPKALTPGEEQRKRYCTVAEFRRLRESGELRVERNRGARGIPQGIQLSAVLSNLYMLDFDRRLSAEIERRGGLYRRYSDDILIALPAGQEAGFSVDEFLREALAERRLPLNEEKTTRHRAEPGRHDRAPRVTPPVVYLGLAYDGDRILLRGATLARFHRRMAHAVQRAQRRSEASDGRRRLPKAKLRKRFTHVGRRNFFSYVRPIEEILREHGFDRPTAIRRQLRRSQSRLERLLEAGGGLD
jgi:hypothetical protein